MAKFQIKLSGAFTDYKEDEDKVLKRAFMAGFPMAKYQFRDQMYEYNFKTMQQTNTSTGKSREFRAPHKWKQPTKPIVPKGETMVVKVPPGKAGKTIEVDHPKDKSKTITVLIPKGAKPGQTMLVPVPALTPGDAKDKQGKALQKAVDTKGSKTSTGQKVAVAGAVIGGVGIAAAAGAGAVLIAEHGADGAVDIVGDTFDDAGDWIAGAAGDAADWAGDAGGDIADFAGDAGDFVVDAGESVGDFIMDLF